MSDYILKYARDERVKYISHLDFMRLFHRTIRRTGLNFVFSQGFNPHPIMTVAQPLSVGVTSDCEYMRVSFDDDLDADEIMDTINAAFPPGYKILAAKKVQGKEIDLTKLDRAVYAVELEYEGIADVDALMARKAALRTPTYARTSTLSKRRATTAKRSHLPCASRSAARTT